MVKKGVGQRQLHGARFGQSTITEKIHRQPGHLNPPRQHRARQREGFEFFRVAVVAGAGDIQGFQVFTTKTDCCRTLHGHWKVGQQFAMGWLAMA